MYILFMIKTAIARVHRQVSDENVPQLSGDVAPGLTTQLQVSTAQVRLFFKLFLTVSLNFTHIYINVKTYVNRVCVIKINL